MPTLERYNLAVPPDLFQGFEIARERILFGLDGDRTFSYTDQLGKLGIGDGLRPDIIAVTLYSAVPMADIVRGAYSAAGLDEPHIIGIRASRSSSFNYSIEPKSASKEIDRLAPIVCGKSVTVIDEFSSTGITLKYAGTLLTAAQAASFTLLPGRWYHDANLSQLDIDGLSSPLSDELRKVGAEAFDLFTKGIRCNEIKD